VLQRRSRPRAGVAIKSATRACKRPGDFTPSDTRSRSYGPKSSRSPSGHGGTKFTRGTLESQSEEIRRKPITGMRCAARAPASGNAASRPAGTRAELATSRSDMGLPFRQNPTSCCSFTRTLRMTRNPPIDIGDESAACAGTGRGAHWTGNCSLHRFAGPYREGSARGGSSRQNSASAPCRAS